MPKALVFPGRSEQGTYDPRTEHDVLFALGTVHIAPSNVANVVQREGKPQARVPGEAEEPRPTPCDEEWVQEEAMRSM